MDDDHDELLQVTDDESSSTDDQDHDHCPSIQTQDDENYVEDNRYPMMNWNYSKCEFIMTKVALIFSTTCLMILLPTYLDSQNIESDAYNLILINSTFSVVCFVLLIVAGKLFFNSYKNWKLTECPIKISKIIVLSLLYTGSGYLIIYAVDRKRVMCHLQDPIKASILVFSLLYYFIFCRKLMGLQRIFSATTIIVGLFIAVDYGLCDEFRCRGYERVRVSDDTGNWPWKIHTTWTIIYVIGLALFSGYFTLMERYLLVTEAEETIVNTTPSFLTTISRAVAFPPAENQNNLIRTRAHVEFNHKLSAVHIALSIHVIGWIFIVLTFWTDIIPSVGKVSSISEFLNMSSKGIICHFQPQLFQSKELSGCGNTFIFSWLFLGSYIFFSIMSIKFLLMTQSAVYTVATISSSLPLVGIWWSLFMLFPLQNGGSVILWSPSLSGEMICSLLGLPVVLIGLFLFCKSHFRECRWSGLTSSYITMPQHFA